MDGLASSYFDLGLSHILDIEGYDHMLFLLALGLPFLLKDWKKVLLLATAFTIGHSITLALAVYDVIKFPTNWVEFFIPVTIMIMGLLDLLKEKKSTQSIEFVITVLFGLIHGMGFSNFLRATLMPGEENLLGWQLLFFNIGLEVGQIMVVLVILFLLQILFKIIKEKKFGIVQKGLTILVILWSLWMATERIPL